jgi:uncharacterized phage-associated protein
MENVYSVANEFLALAENSNKQLTNLQLAKLCYIAHGLSLAILNKKAFNEPIEAWKFGPVIPQLYREFKNFGSSAIDRKATVVDSETLESKAPEVQDNNLKKVIALTWNIYKDVSGSNLVSITHGGNTPWSLTFVSGANKEISDELTLKYYKKFIENLEHELA